MRLLCGEEFFAAEGVDGDGDIVVDGKTFAAVGFGVMKAAAEVEGEAAVECAAGGGDGSGSGPAHGLQDEAIEEPPGARRRAGTSMAVATTADCLSERR